MLRTAFGVIRPLVLAGWVVAVAMVSAAMGQEAPRIDPDDQWRLAEMYLGRGDTDRAVSEFERFCFFFPQDARTPEAGLRIGRALLGADRFDEAVKAFGRVVEAGRGPSAVLEAHFWTAEVYRRWGRTGQAFLSLQNILSTQSDPYVTDEAWFRMGWLAVESGLGEKAIEYFSKMSGEGSKRRRISEIEARLPEMARLPEKSSTLSGALSVVPGLGYLYCDRPRDAAMSFLVNAALIGATWEAFREDLPILGTVLTLVEIGFYGGNIYGGVAAAHKHNRAGRRHFVDQLKERFNVTLGPVTLDHGLGLGVKGSF